MSGSAENAYSLFGKCCLQRVSGKALSPRTLKAGKISGKTTLPCSVSHFHTSYQAHVHVRPNQRIYLGLAKSGCCYKWHLFILAPLLAGNGFEHQDKVNCEPQEAEDTQHKSRPASWFSESMSHNWGKKQAASHGIQEGSAKALVALK